jgi:hypothetical protein
VLGVRGVQEREREREREEKSTRMKDVKMCWGRVVDSR